MFFFQKWGEKRIERKKKVISFLLFEVCCEGFKVSPPLTRKNQTNSNPK